MDTNHLEIRSKKLRKKIFQSVYEGNGGHIGGSFSVIDMLNYLYSEVLIYDPQNPKLEYRDRLVFSKGHSCLALYWILCESGFFKEELIKSYGADNSVMSASQLKLDNYYIIVDNNGMESLDRTDNIMSIEPIDKKFNSFGFDVVRTNGHDFKNIDSAFKSLPLDNFKPKCIISDTVKAYGLSFTAGIAKWHYRSPDEDEYMLGLKELS